MFLRAGAISLGLLLASRLLGLLRETVQAAAFGASGLADVVVLMLTIPDWITGVLVSGALAYVLLPHWARQSHPAQMALQRRVARVLVVAGLGLGLLLAFFPGGLMVLLAPGLPASLAQVSRQAVWWSAAALAPALLAALWATRLQHLRDFLGLYAANLVFTGVVTLALAVAALAVLPAGGLQGLGPALLGAALLRLAWLAWRMHMAREGSTAGASEPAAQAGADAAPGVRVWLWASLAAGLPLVLPFAARSLASAGGAGQLATFNYAWKLVELPLLLAIQLVATLTLPVVARTLADGRDPAPALRRAFALAWVLACAAIAGLLAGAPAVAQLLFGWGRMTPHDVQRMAQWGAGWRVGAVAASPSGRGDDRARRAWPHGSGGRGPWAGACHAAGLGDRSGGRWYAPDVGPERSVCAGRAGGAGQPGPGGPGLVALAGHGGFCRSPGWYGRADTPDACLHE